MISRVYLPEKLLGGAELIMAALMLPEEARKKKTRHDDIYLNIQSRQACAENPNGFPRGGEAAVRAAQSEGLAGARATRKSEPVSQKCPPKTSTFRLRRPQTQRH